MPRLRSRWWLLAFCLALLCGFWVAPVAAHPLGNFTINTYSRLDFADGAVRLTYAIDLAEVPTFQLQQDRQIDANGDGLLDQAEANAFLDNELPQLLDGLRLIVGDRTVALTTLDRAAAFVPGQGGLQTLRVSAHFGGLLPDGREHDGTVYYADTNYHDRLGWREIVVRGGPGVAVQGETGEDRSDELRAYPADLLNDPPARYNATFTIAPGAEPGVTARVAALLAHNRPPLLFLLALLAIAGGLAARTLTRTRRGWPAPASRRAAPRDRPSRSP